jgi:hypothetical protein
MSTVTKHYCDKCGAESPTQYPRYALVSLLLGSGLSGVLTQPTELCKNCCSELEHKFKELTARKEKT